MNVIKSLFGSLIGAAIGIGIYYAIKQSTGETYVWFPVVIGALIGLFGNFFYSKNCGNGVRFACGALAAVVAFGATFGIDLAPSLLATPADYSPIDLSDRMVAVSDVEATDAADGSGTQETTGSDTNAESESGSATNDSATEGSGAADADGSGTNAGSDSTTTTSPNDAFKDRANGGKGMGAGVADPDLYADLIKKRSNKTWYDIYLPYILNGVGILLAYQFARGFGSAPVRSAAEG